MAQVLARDPDQTTVKTLKKRATANGRSLQSELEAILEGQPRLASKAEARAPAARIRRSRGGRKPYTGGSCDV